MGTGEMLRPENRTLGSDAADGTADAAVILRGFNPDPSICRVGNDYYIATSTFEWYPGVRIYKADKGLANWEFVTSPLCRDDLLNLEGVPDSCGVWAPCLSYADDKFWLCYTIVRRFDGDFKDTHNYLVTAPSISGPWSSRQHLNSSGFDPSLFHDEDGSKWFVNMVWDHRPDRDYFGGIVLQRYCTEEGRLIGERKLIFTGTALGRTEGPHLYKLNGYYYLITAEGGTGYEHAVTVARSRRIDGPYEVMPDNPLITARKVGGSLQRCGHASLARSDDGTFWMPFLCSRPISGTRRSPRGRETALTKVAFDKDGWLRTLSWRSDTVKESDSKSTRRRYTFNSNDLDTDFQWLRTPKTGRLFSLSARPGYLRLFGHEATGSLFEQSIVARRQSSIDVVAETSIEFEPENPQQMAGLICYYNSHKYHYLYLTADDAGQRQFSIMSCLGDLSLQGSYALGDEIVRAVSGEIYMRAAIKGAVLMFFYSIDGTSWTQIGPQLDASLLSDESGKGEGANFTGAFIGMSCNDSSGAGCVADFKSFSYRENEE